MSNFFISFLISSFGRLSLAGARRAGAILGWCAFRLKDCNYRRTQKNIQRCFPLLNQQEQTQLVRDSLKETGKVFVEACVIWHRDWPWLQTKIVGVEGEEILREELAQQKGLLVLAPHFGNWEVVGPYLVSHAPLTVMYKPAAIPQLDKLIYNARTALNMQLAPTNRKGVSMLLKALQSGGVVGILPDQLPEPGAGAEAAPFFGQSAMTMTLAHALISRTGCRVVACVAVRVAQGFTLVTLPVDEAIYSQDIQISAAAMNRTIERCVLLAPAQYQWEYNRFRLNVPKSQQPAEI